MNKDKLVSAVKTKIKLLSKLNIPVCSWATKDTKNIQTLDCDYAIELNQGDKFKNFLIENKNKIGFFEFIENPYNTTHLWNKDIIRLKFKMK